jgi:hypothetical protein
MYVGINFPVIKFLVIESLVRQRLPVASHGLLLLLLPALLCERAAGAGAQAAAAGAGQEGGARGGLDGDAVLGGRGLR